jgi:type IV pilus assembly protein PilY1
MKTKHYLRSLLASAMTSALLLQAGVSYADDTEIFFGGSTIDSGIRPNVLFILDDSGSMNDRQNPTRMTQMKTAFGTIMQNAGNINVGVMALNKDPRMLSTVKNIDESINVKLSSPSLMASGDDASRADGATNISDSTLVMGHIDGTANTYSQSLGLGNDNSSYYIKGNYSCSTKIDTARSNCDTGAKTQLNARSGTGTGRYTGLFLFRNLNIPSSAAITSAKLTLTAANSQTSNKPAITISLENNKTPAAFNDDSTVTGRDFSITTALANNSGKLPNTWTKDQAFEIDITDQLTSLKGTAPSTNPIADLALQFRSTTDREYSYYVGDTAQAPTLTVTYSTTTSSSRTTGLRFQNVAIPKGASITSARIDFVPAASDARTVTFAVTAQNAADAAPFTVGEDFPNSRPKTATSSTWQPTEWRTSSPQVYVDGPIVTSLVQNVIDSNDWCGNNSMAFFLTPNAGNGSRTALSFDAAQGLQPVLNVSYTGGDTGCLNPILNISVVDEKDDGSQSKSGSDPRLGNSTLSFDNAYIASRYQKVPVKQGATVIDAQIIVTPNNTGTGTASAAFQAIGDSPALSTAENNLSSRTLTTAAATCSFTSTVAGTPVSCAEAGIKTQLQSIFSRSDWTDGNALTLMLKPTSKGLDIKARESSIANAITLRIKLASGGLGENNYTVRDYTNGVVQNLSASGNTPLVPTLYDAARYLAQKPGKHGGSDPSPITSSCQANYLVLLTDGEANGQTSTSQEGIAALTGKGCTGDSSYGSEKCGRSLVKWLATADLADYEGLNTVTTHTIGFNTSGNKQATAFLNDLAKEGGGKAYQAENAGDLAKAFDDIVQAALATNTSFVNTSAPVNSFNRADNLDELYFALFRPSENDRWAGNLKRYRMKTEGNVATIVDADDIAAIDSNTGFFKSSARSFWSQAQDGSDIAKGGAALKLPLPASRKLLTYIGTSPSGTATEMVPLSNITAANLGDSSMSTTERDKLRAYISGLDVDSATTPSPARYALGDPIHSSPRLVTYGCNAYTAGECTSPDLSAVMGSNEGFVHAFDTDTGVEEFAFMPEALLPNIKQLMRNEKSSSQKPRLYGMDNTVTLWANDANNNGVIYGNPSTGATGGLNSGEFVYAYATMGRGGRNIYALDITNRSAPKILWHIIGGLTPGFEKLGQTWSTPVKTRIDVGGTIKDVLIFAGGYDVNQDELNLSTSVRTPDTSMGNAIYIVDAKTGEKIWSASQNNTVGTHDEVLAKMQYSIPSPVRVIDIQEANGVLVNDAQKLADQFFVGDMGGQVWRFYINNGSSGSGLISPAGTGGDGVFASIGGTTPASARRFYNEPDVSLLNVNGARSLAVSIGSGYRGHPLNEYIEDRFYAFRTASLFKTGNQGTLTESDLYDATQNLVQAGSDTQKDTAKAAFKLTTGGWYIKLTHSGEKVLSRALTAGGVLYFNTYEPSISSVACSAAVGKNRAYSARLLDATPASVPVNGNGSPDDRAESSNSEGIAGDPQLFCKGDKCWVLKDPSLSPDPVDAPPPGKTYWMDSSNL